MVQEIGSSPPELEAVWAKYGLKESPYSTSPMRLLSILPIQNVFSGRSEEVSLMKKMIRSKNSTRNLVVGAFGVGKTTFTNYIKWSLAIKNKEASNYLVTNTEVKVQPNWDAVSFLFSTLSAIYNSSIIFSWESKGINTNSIKKLKDYVEITRLKNIQGSIAGFGAGYGESQGNPPSISPEILEKLLVDVCTELLNQGKQLIISYDNLENIETEKLSELFRSIRDYLQIEGLHTIFMGSSSVISALEANGQVHSVFSRPIILQPLSEKDVIEILEKRCESLKFENGNYIRPYNEKTVKTLYLKLNKNIRFTFKVLEDATIHSEKFAPCEITMNEIIAVQEQEKKEILSALTETQLKIISALLERLELTVTDLSSATEIGITNITTPIKDLSDK